MIGIGLAINQGNSGGIEAAIRALFANSEQGAWYDPSDFSTLYQDNYGGTPVTAVEQPVGMMLDKRKGTDRGVELAAANYATPGGFDNVTTPLSATSFSITGGTTACRTFLNISGASGAKTYEFSGRVVSLTGGGSLVPYIRNGANGGASNAANGIGVQAGGTFRVIGTIAAGATDACVLFISSVNGISATVDSISVREVGAAGSNHASQATAAARPILSARVNQFLQTEDFSTGPIWTNTALGTAVAPVITNNYGVAPDGTTTAARVQLSLGGSTTSADMARLRQTVSGLSAAINYVSSIWVKSTDSNSYTCQMILPNGSGQTLTITPTWTKIEATSLGAGTGSAQLGVMLRGAQTPTHSDTADFLVWHPQFETGTVATRYQRVGPLRNLAISTDDLSTAAWAKNSVTVTGTDMVTSLNGANQGFNNAANYTVVPGQNITISMDVKLGTMSASNFKIAFYNFNTLSFIDSDIVPATVPNNVVFQRITHTITVPGGCTLLRFYPFRNSAAVAGTVYIKNIQVEVGSTATTYERVDTAANTYDTVGFPVGLRFDGVDDFMQAGAIDFTGGDSIGVWTGLNKLSDASSAIVVELGAADSSLTPGTFRMCAPASSGVEKFNFASNGSNIFVATTTSTTYNAPIKAVVVGYADVSLDTVRLRVNGSVLSNNTGDQGTGNYKSDVLYIGMRGGSTLPYNGIMYGVLIRAGYPTSDQLVLGETYQRNKSQAY